MSTTIKYLQEYIKAKDNHPELVKDYFLKLTEEMGELSEAICIKFTYTGKAGDFF